MLVNPMRLTGDHAEQSAEILHHGAPRFFSQSEPLHQRSHVHRGGPGLARDSSPSRPVQQFQVLCRRHWQKALVAATAAALMNVRPGLAAAFLQVYRRQMPSTMLLAA